MLRTPAASASRAWSPSGATRAYPAGRTRAWIKSKCSDRQEFVIAGYVPSTVDGRLIGSLVLGYYRDGGLMHAGRVGTGFNQAVARDLTARLGRWAARPRLPREAHADAAAA